MDHLPDPNNVAAIIAAIASLFTAFGIAANAVVSILNLFQSRDNHTVVRRVESSVNGRMDEMKGLYVDREEARVEAMRVAADAKAIEARVGSVLADSTKKVNQVLSGGEKDV